MANELLSDVNWEALLSGDIDQTWAAWGGKIPYGYETVHTHSNTLSKAQSFMAKW